MIPKIEAKASVDLSDSANEILKNALSNPAKETGQTMQTVIGYIHNTLLFKMRKRNLYAENELKIYADKLENERQQLPIYNLTEPSIHIWGPAFEHLKYKFNEEHIKEMFMNILISDINITKKNNVLPSYIEVVAQLSNSDAELLKELKKYKTNRFYILKIENSDNVVLASYYIPDNIENFDTALPMEEIVIDNLKRLNILDVNYMLKFRDGTNYERLVELVKEKFGSTSTVFNRGTMILTKYGANLMDICLDNEIKG